VLILLFVFLYKRLEDNPHQNMFGTGPEIAMFENIAPYVSLFITFDVMVEVILGCAFFVERWTI